MYYFHLEKICKEDTNNRVKEMNNMPNITCKYHTMHNSLDLNMPPKCRLILWTSMCMRLK